MQNYLVESASSLNYRDTIVNQIDSRYLQTAFPIVDRL